MMGIKVSFLMTECAICGHRSATNWGVVGAEGSYCDAHKDYTMRMAKRQRDKELYSMLATGTITLPTKPWTPSTPPRDGVE